MAWRGRGGGGGAGSQARHVTSPQPTTADRMTNHSLREAVALWFKDKEGRKLALERYGVMSSWDVTDVTGEFATRSAGAASTPDPPPLTDMAELFKDQAEFREEFVTKRQVGN